MTQTYAQIAKKIATLQAKAETQKSREILGVVARIRSAIAVYALTSAQLFDTVPARAAARNKRAKRATRKSGKTYADSRGNTWGGLGPRPSWLKEELRKGKTLSEFSSASLEGRDRAGPQAGPTTDAGTPRRGAKAAFRGIAAPVGLKSTKSLAKAKAQATSTAEPAEPGKSSEKAVAKSPAPKRASKKTAPKKAAKSLQAAKSRQTGSSKKGKNVAPPQSQSAMNSPAPSDASTLVKPAGAPARKLKPSPAKPTMKSKGNKPLAKRRATPLSTAARGSSMPVEDSVANVLEAGAAVSVGEAI